jgi:hypothetical protein
LAFVRNQIITFNLKDLVYEIPHTFPAAVSGEGISASHVEDDGGSPHLMETSTVKVPPMETTTTQEPQHQGPTEQPQQQPQQQQQMRKDLNELPEMRKAKELRAEGEKAEIEADTLREMARLEEELKRAEAQKEEEAAHAKPEGEGGASGNPEEAANLVRKHGAKWPLQ